MSFGAVGPRFSVGSFWGCLLRWGAQGSILRTKIIRWTYPNVDFAAIHPPYPTNPTIPTTPPSPPPPPILQNAIKGVIDTLRGQLNRLEAEIKADEKGKWEFDLVIGQLENRKKDLQQRIKMNEEWAKQYDLKIGPFEETYDSMTASIGKTYDNAKAGHARGLQVLKDEFGYHPAFKQKDDAFFAIPFKPL